MDVRNINEIVLQLNSTVIGAYPSHHREQIIYNNINTYDAMGKFSRRQTDDKFLIFARK